MSIQMFDLAAAEEDRRFSPFCWRVRMALAHKGLAVETVPWRFSDKERLRALGAGETVPVVVDGARTVSDSWAIACYLEDAYPDRPALFGGPEARGLSLLVKHWVEQAIHPAIVRLVLRDIHDHLAAEDQPYFRASREQRFGTTLEAVVADPEGARKALDRALQPARATLSAQPFLAGEGPNYADYILFGAFQWARAISPRRLIAPEDPIFAWRERMLDLFGGLARQSRAYPG